MDDRRLRKYQNALSISGLGVIAFTLWDIVKGILSITLNPSETPATPPADSPLVGMDTQTREMIAIVLIVGLLVLSVLDIAIRLYVGLSANAEGRGRRRGVLYLVLCVPVALLTIVTIVNVANPANRTMALDFRISTILMELTSLFCTFEVFVSAILVKRHARTHRG